ncbi:MAG: TetR/AcrR family transcriptional regulator [Bryobacteraceae bacterium]
MDTGPVSLRERNRVETRARLVHAALDLFAEEGFDNVPVERICEVAAVSRATFFNYFTQKEELLFEIGRQRLERVEQFIDAQKAWDQPPSAESLIELFVEFGRANEELSPMGRHVLLRALSSPSVAARIAQMLGTLRDRVSEYLGRLAPRAKPPGFDAKATAENLVAIYFWTTLEFMMQPEPAPGRLPEDMRRRLTALLAPLRKSERRSR